MASQINDEIWIVACYERNEQKLHMGDDVEHSVAYDVDRGPVKEPS